MKHLALTLLILGTGCNFGFADSELSRELEKLTLERDKALTTANESIQRRYKEALEPLMRKATQAGDLDTAVRIKELLEGAPNPKAQYVGVWKFQNLTDGYKDTRELLSDGTFLESKKRMGKWDVQGDKLLMTYDAQPGNTDRMNLPLRDGKLEGKNSFGHVLVIERKGS